MAEESDARFVIGRMGGIEDVDDGACALLGYTRAEILELHGADLVLPEERPAVAVSLDQMRHDTLRWRQGRLLRKDRGVVRVEVRSRPLPEGRLELNIRALADGPR